MAFLSRYALSLILGSALVLSSVACGDDDDDNGAAGTGGTSAGSGGTSAGGTSAGNGGAGAGGSAGAAASDIVATAASLPDYSTLVELVTAANLVDTLKGAGPFTVFAPNNAAFTKFLADTQLTLDDLKKPENQALLSDILLFHASAQASAATPATKGLYAAELKTLLDLPKDGALGATTAFLDLAVSGDTIDVGLAPPLPFQGRVTTADVAASNGVIHGINAVLIPPKYVDYGTSITFKASGAKSGVVDLVTYAATVGFSSGGSAPVKEFTTLAGLVTKCSLASTLAGAEALTVFAPTDAAFAKAGVTVAAADCAALTPVLTYHVVPAITPASAAVAAAKANTKVKTVSGKDIGFKVDGGKVVIVDGSTGSPTVVIKNIQSANAVVHVIDTVLTPPT